MGKAKLFLGALLVICLLGGCKASTPEVSSIVINKNGAVTQVMVEAFAQDYYDEAELRKMVEEEVAAYQGAAGEAAVKMKVFDVEEGTARVHLRFDSAQDYQGFNGTELFVGTLTQAHEAGYSIPKMKEASGKGEVLSGEEILAQGKRHVVIFEEHVQVHLPKKVLYVSENLEAIGSHEVDLLEREQEKKGLFYVIY